MGGAGERATGRLAPRVPSSMLEDLLGLRCDLSYLGMTLIDVCTSVLLPRAHFRPHFAADNHASPCRPSMPVPPLACTLE